jgi:hypothetical protein
MAVAAAKPKHERPKTITTGAWASLGIHTITLPSSAVVKIRIPDLSMLLAGEAVPEHLRAVAFDAVRSAIKAENRRVGLQAIDDSSDELNHERLKGLADLNRFLVSHTLLEPTMTEEDLLSTTLPVEDLAMLTQIASRERTTDARGVQIGVEPIDRWELWRQAHECESGCEGCAEVLAELSSVDLA